MARSILKLDDQRTTTYGTNSCIEINGKDILKLSEKSIHKFRGEIVSMVFQNPMHSLNPSFTIGAQLRRVLMAHSNYSRLDSKIKILSALKSVDLPGVEELIQRYPHELSGGQCQRVMVAMAILCEPKLIVADEPTSALDVTAQDKVLQILKKLSIENKIAVLMITHDMGVVAQFCEIVNVMYGGRIVETADVKTLFTKPAHPYTAALLAATPDPSKPKKVFNSIPGLQESRTGEISSACAFIKRCKFAQPICDQAPEFRIINDGQSVACHFAGELSLSK